jgi:hypothetical protein
MSARQIVALVGAGLLFFGVFAPIISVPLLGSMNYFQNGKVDGTIVLEFAGLTAILALLRAFTGLWITALVSAGTIGYTFYAFHSKLEEMKAKMAGHLAGNPFKGLADAFMNSVQLQ